MKSAQRSLVVLIGEYARAVISFATTFVTAHLLGPEINGIIGYHLGILGMFAIFLDLGFSTTHIKKISENKDVEICLGTFLTFKIISLSIYVLAIAIFVASQSHSDSIHLIRNYPVLITLFCYYIFDQATSVLLSTFSGRQEFLKFNIPTTISRLAKLVLVIIFGFLSYGELGLAIAYLFDGIVSFGIGFYLLRKQKISIRRPTKEMMSSYLKYALPMMVIIPISVFSSNIDRVMIGRLSNMTQVGYYFTVQNFLVVINSISSAAMTVFLPAAARTFAEGRQDDLIKSLSKSVRYLSILVTPLAFFIYFNAFPLIRLFLGVRFLDAAPVLQVFSLIYLIAATARPYSNILYSTESHHLIIYISIANVLILLIGNYFTIPIWGAAGAAIINLVMWVFASISQIRIALRYLKTNFEFRIFKHLICGVLSGFSSNGIINSWFGWSKNSDIMHLIISAGLFFCTYFLFLVMLREWKENDWIYFKSLFNLESLAKEFSRKTDEAANCS